MDTFHAVIIDAINLIFTIRQGEIVELKSSIKNVLKQKSVTPKHLAKIAEQFSYMYLVLGPIDRLFFFEEQLSRY